MARRVERIAAPARGSRARRAVALAVVRHVPRDRRAAAARVCAREIGLDAAFTIHDREDSADLMNLVRHELGFSQTERALPDQGHLPRDLFARRQRAGAARRRCSARRSRGAPHGRPSCARCSPPTSRRSSARTCSTTTTCCSTGRRWSAEPAIAAEIARALRPRAGRRIPGHQPPAGVDPARAQARRARPDRGRRRRAVDLFVPRRDRAQHPRFPAAVHSAGAHRHARAQLPLDAADPRGLERRDRARRRALHARRCGRSASRERARRSSRCATRATRRATSPSACWRTARRASR